MMSLFLEKENQLYLSFAQNCYKIINLLTNICIVFKIQQMSSYTRQLLNKIADKIGRNRKDMDQFVGVLEKNWYDSKQSLQTLTINDFDRFDIPRRISSLIMEEIGSNNNNQQFKYNQQQTKMDMELSVDKMLQKLQSKTSKQKFDEYIDLLTKIFRNIRQNLTNEKFRILKKSNKKIAQLISIPEISQILSYGGFDNTAEAIVMNNISISKIDECIDYISKYNVALRFDPYKSGVISTSGKQSTLEGQQSSVVYNEKLKQLQKYREQIMSRPVKNREVKIYREVGQQIKPDKSWSEDRELNETQKQYMDSVKQKLKHYNEEAKFMNRRKQQYFQLMKKPCFSETYVKIKLPDNWIFQCKFSPLETLGDLVKVFHEYVEDKNLPYYLYMTPPVEKLSGLTLRQTFYEKGCVPRALFYFGSDEKISQNILKQKKTGINLFG